MKVDKLEIVVNENVVLEEYNFGELDFSSSEPVDITVTLRYDYAILQF